MDQDLGAIGRDVTHFCAMDPPYSLIDTRTLAVSRAVQAMDKMQAKDEKDLKIASEMEISKWRQDL
jgi:hypothetical protein